MNAATLAALAEALERGEAVPQGEAAEMATALREAVEGNRRLDEALGLRGGRGKRLPATKLMLARRDALLREAAARFFGGPKPDPQGTELV